MRSRPRLRCPSRPPYNAYSLNLLYWQDDETALHIAAYHGHVDVVRVLTEKRDRLAVNARDKVRRRSGRREGLEWVSIARTHDMLYEGG